MDEEKVGKIVAIIRHDLNQTRKDMKDDIERRDYSHASWAQGKESALQSVLSLFAAAGIISHKEAYE